MSVIFNLKYSEYMEGPIGPQIEHLAFNNLRTQFCTPILSPPSIPIATTCNHITPHKKRCSSSLNFGCLTVIHPYNYSIANE